MIPEGFVLDSRTLLPGDGSDLPPGAIKDPKSGPEVGSGHPRLITTYRFQNSVNVPGIVLTEYRPGAEGTEVDLSPAQDGCGEELAQPDGEMFYANGFVSKEPGPVEGQLNVCLVAESPARDVHTVLVARGDILVEVLVFPESGLTRDEVLGVASSLTEAE